KVPEKRHITLRGCNLWGSLVLKTPHGKSSQRDADEFLIIDQVEVERLCIRCRACGSGPYPHAWRAWARHGCFLQCKRQPRSHGITASAHQIKRGLQSAIKQARMQDVISEAGCEDVRQTQFRQQLPRTDKHLFHCLMCRTILNAKFLVSAVYA